MACGCSICEVFEHTTDDLSAARHRDDLKRGMVALHNLYQGQADLSDEQENQLYEKMIRLAGQDGLNDLKKTLEHLYDSCD